MAQVQGPRRILLHAEVQRLDPGPAGAAVVGVAVELQAGAPEALLGLEDGLVAQRHLDRLEAGVVETAVGHGGEQQDVGPLQALALDVVGAVGRALPRGVKVGQLQRRRHAAVEHDGAFHRPAGLGRDQAAAQREKATEERETRGHCRRSKGEEGSNNLAGRIGNECQRTAPRLWHAGELTPFC